MPSEPDRVPPTPAGYLPLADYGVIGDGRSIALVANTGAIDWWCLPRFDGDPIFARLLDTRLGGSCVIQPCGPFQGRQAYLGETNVLVTTFATDAGEARVVDFMPALTEEQKRRYPIPFRAIVRRVEGISGHVPMQMVVRPRPDYGRLTPRVRQTRADRYVIEWRDQALHVTSSVPLRIDPGTLAATFDLMPGQRVDLVLSYSSESPAELPTLGSLDLMQRLTVGFWEAWIQQCSYPGPYQEAVRRSALVLKLLTYAPSGAIIAAPTTSLPEQIGGVRNWDYRYTWLRDSSLMLYALLSVGYEHEAVDFFLWLRSACMPPRDGDPQIMYTIDGGRELPEYTLDHLEGYRGSRPVRVGNAAATQKQHDIYGEVLTTAYLYYRPESGAHSTNSRLAGQHRPGAETWQLLTTLVEQAARHWSEPGAGIWEMRATPQHFLYSKLLCWAALDRGIRLATEFGLPAPLDRWRATREAIRNAILEQGWNRQRGAFTQAFGSDALDASALVIPRIGFLPASDPRVRATVAAIQRELTEDGLVRRYRTPDGLPGSEGTFLLCSFWLVDALAFEGRVDEARALFERLTRYGNDLGLFSEEVDARDGTLLGNFPQGFTHLALIDSAVNLAAAVQGRPETKTHTEGERVGPARQAAAG